MIEKYFTEYCKYVDTLSLSKSTKECYKRDIKMYIDFLNKNNILPDRINTKVIHAFEKDIHDKSLSTQNRMLSSIRNFHKFLSKNNYIHEEPKFRSIKIENTDFDITETILTEEEIKTIFIAINNSKSKYKLRDKIMLEILYKCGLKISEIENLKISDINLFLEYISVKTSINKLRVIPIDKGLTERIDLYINNYRKELSVKEGHQDYMFLNKDNEKMTRQGIWKVIKKYAKLSGIEKNINSNTFRLSLAYNLVLNGADTSLVNKYLGNKSFSIIAKLTDGKTKFRSSILKYNINLEEI